MSAGCQKMHFELVEPCRHCSKMKCARQDYSSACRRRSYIASLPGQVWPFAFLVKLRPSDYPFCAKQSCKVKWKRTELVLQSLAIIRCFTAGFTIGRRHGRPTNVQNTVVLGIVESQEQQVGFVHTARISSRISNEVKGVNRVCYDISSEPPGE